MGQDLPLPDPSRRGGRRKGSGKRADATAPWEQRAVQALADGSRWSIVRYISEHPSNIGGLARALGLSVACTSKHVAILREARLIEVERRGREALCRLIPTGTPGADLLRAVGIEAKTAGDPGLARSTSAIPEFEDRAISLNRRYKSNDLDDYLL